MKFLIRTVLMLLAGLAPATASAQVTLHGVGDLPGGPTISVVRDATKPQFHADTAMLWTRGFRFDVNGSSNSVIDGVCAHVVVVLGAEDKWLRRGTRHRGHGAFIHLFAVLSGTTRARLP